MMAQMVQKHEKRFYRFFEILPGLFVWGFLLSPIWLGIFAPKLIIFHITLLTVWWATMAGKHTIGGIIGYKRYQKELKQDWWAKCKELDFGALPDKITLPKTLSEVKHFVLIPAYSEPKEVLAGCIEALLQQTFPLEQITLVFAFEERYSDRLEFDVRELLGPKITDFDEVLFYTHPAGIPLEAKGVAGPNRTWGAKNAVGHLKLAGKNMRDYIFTTFDSDSVLHPQFLSRVAHLYLSNNRRLHKFYSTALHLYNNNIWKVPMMMRIEANAVTLASLSDWIVGDAEYKETFSCYSSALQTLIDADYWDVQLGVDDTLFYWRAFFARDGDFEGVEHYIPYSADAVQAETTLGSHKSMYLQLRRWAWGTIAMPLSLTGFLKNNKISKYKKIRWTWLHFERRILLFTLVFLMTFGVSMLTLVNQGARQINLVYTLPDLMSVLLTITLIFILPITILRVKIIKPMPKEWSTLKKFILTITEGPLIILNLLTFSLIPWLDAYTRMMLGKKMSDLYHTPKIRS